VFFTNATKINSRYKTDPGFISANQLHGDSRPLLAKRSFYWLEPCNKNPDTFLIPMF